MGIACAAVVSCVIGCASAPGPSHEKVRMNMSDSLPARMKARSDLIDMSDCRVTFDLAGIPEETGIPLVKYNPFEDSRKQRMKSALCPIRAVFGSVLEDGSSRIFNGGEATIEATVKIIPFKIGITREGASAHCAFSCTATLGDEKIGLLEADMTSLWLGETEVPECVYAVAANIGDQLMAHIARSTRLKSLVKQISSQSGEIPPSADKWSFSEIVDGRFSGDVSVKVGSWDMARVQLWARNQIESIAKAKLGIDSLQNCRILMDWGESPSSSSTISLHFKVFPYRGFEVTYDSRRREGVCVADILFLKLDEETAYSKAVAFIENMLSDQGVVKTSGTKSSAAQYRFNGYRSIDGGTKLEIRFELVQ